MTKGDALNWADTTALLEALAGACSVLWRWDSGTDQLHLMGDLRGLGVKALGPSCRRDAFLAMVDFSDQARAKSLFDPAAEQTPRHARLRFGEGPVSIWRGVRLEHGGCITGVASPDYETLDRRDPLTGLLDRAQLHAPGRGATDASGRRSADCGGLGAPAPV